MLIQGQVGAPSSSVTAGSNPTIRQGQLGDVIVSELHGLYYEANYRGNLFSTFINALTLASTHATPLAAGSGTPIIGMHNPVGSGKVLSINRIGQSTTSGTPGGPLLLNVIQNPQNITATVTGTYLNNASLAQSGSVVRLFNNVATTGSTAGTAFRTVGGPSTGASALGIQTFVDNVQGSIIVPPGLMLGLACTAAGTSHIISCWIEWEEVPI